jgi:hypothetical protein
MVQALLNIRSLLNWPSSLTSNYRCKCSCDCLISKNYPGPCCLCRHGLHEFKDGAQ